MKALLAVFRKEVRENLRDRRTVFSALIFGPLFGPIILALSLQFLVQRSTAETDDPVQLAVSHAERAPNLVGYLRSRNVEITEVALTDEAARTAVRERTHALVLDVPADFGEALAAGEIDAMPLYSDASDSLTARRAARVRMLVAQYGANIGRLRLQARGIDPGIVAPFAVRDLDVSTPRSRSVTVLGTLSYLVLVAMLLGGLYLAIDSTAGERERGSLEPLLTTPVAREHLIYGKILAACAFMLASLVVTVIACAVALRFVGLEEFGMTARLDASTVLRIVLVTAPLALAGAALMTVVASFTRSYREAQTWVGVILLLPTLPVVFVGLAELAPNLRLMAVPSLSQHFLITTLLRGEALDVAYVALSVASSLSVGIALSWIAGRLYRRESLLG